MDPVVVLLLVFVTDSHRWWTSPGTFQGPKTLIRLPDEKLCKLRPLNDCQASEKL